MKRLNLLIIQGVLLALVSGALSLLYAGWVQGQVGTIVYSVFVPAGYTSTSHLPVLMQLHGVGDRGNNYGNINDQDLQNLCSDSSQAKYPCILYAPQCPTNDQWVAVTGWGETYYPMSGMPPTNAWLDAMRGLDTVIAKYSVDTNRLYLAGGSMGGYGAWYTLCKYPNLFACACPIAGGGDTNAVAPFVNVPLWAFQGTNDPVVPVAGSRTMIRALRRAGGTPNYTEFSDSAIGTNGYSAYGSHIYFLPFPLVPTLKSWIFSQVKGKAVETLSQSSISATYVIGQSWTAQTSTITAVNIAHNGVHITGPFTVTKKSVWLSVAVNASNLDSQVITNTIDPSSLPQTQAKYYDTVTIHAAHGDMADMTYPVQVWIRQSPVLTSIELTPASSQAAIGQDIQFVATLLDQYGVNLSPMPTLTWTATGDGSVNSSGLFVAGTCLGSSTVTVSASGSTANAGVTVFTFDYARGAVPSASSVATGGPLQGMIDGVIGGYPNISSQEWSSNVEKAGAWAQLTWLAPVTIDSIALWDRPNTSDQVTSGTLTFSGGSSITVGALPNDASSPAIVKFTPKTITWVRFTVNSVSSTTYSAGLAEFGVFNTSTCSTNTLNPVGESRTVPVMLASTAKGLSVRVAVGSKWTLDLYGLNGERIAGCEGIGSKEVAFVGKISVNKGFVIARLKSETKEVVKTMSRIQ